MQVRFWGVRGSIPAPGPETNRYGGNTSCVSVTTASGELIIIDMGTGAMPLGHSLMSTDLGRGAGKATLLLSHSHWDHIQGFPFFPPIFVPGNHFSIYGNAKSSSMLEGILEGQMNPHFSPIYTLKNLGADIEFSGVEPGKPFSAAGVTIRACSNPHGVATALAYRLEENGRALVYASDVGYPDSGPSAEALALYHGADVLIHDTTFAPEDRQPRLDRGLSSYVDAARAAALAGGVRHLVLFHYDQDYTDDRVDEMRDACRRELADLGAPDIQVTAAAEALTLDI
ncbi:MAG TPA: MBL fold metallo-hydrolase [Kofleriaceae bacterium]|nr:MBL fold metallo-hydrolase [Kofleriaceae bacterium]